MNINLLKEIITEQKELFEKKENYLLRDILPEIKELLQLPHIIIISGIRRSGKSTLLKQIKEQNFQNETTYYFNFEDERLVNFKVQHFDMLYEAFLELYDESKIFFFDEIQNIQGWESFVRRMYDRNIKFFITGSNSSMLSRELGTKLTGRYIPIELYPFSFKEFLKLNKVSINKIITTKQKAQIKKLFYEYLQKGGFPEYVKYGNQNSLKTLYENILYKDILVRYGLNDEKSLKELSSYLFTNVSKEFSYNKLKKLLKLGSPNTIKNYIGYLETSYLLFNLSRHNYSLKKQIYSNKKVYVIDNGLRNLISFNISKDEGRLMENLVFIELKRRNKEVYFFKENNECDFVITNNGKVINLIQVTLNLQEENTKKREFDGLIEAMKKFKLNSGLIITENEEYEEKIKNKKIKIVPIWKFLLSN